MNLFSIRSFCILASLACLVVTFLVAAYLSALSWDWLSLEHLGLKSGGVTALFFSLYFAGSAAFKRMLWIQLFRSKELLCTLGAIATMVSFLWFMLSLPSLAHMRFDWWLHLMPILSSALVGAICIRAGTGWRVFGFFSLISSLPLGLLSIGPILYTLLPPPPDPVGGNGINVGIQLMLMIPCASIALPTWIASMFLEQRRTAWHILIGLLCLPGSVVLVCHLARIVG